MLILVILELVCLLLATQTNCVAGHSNNREPGWESRLSLPYLSPEPVSKRQPQPYPAITPNGPLLFTSWVPDHCTERDRIAGAFLGTLNLIRYAMTSLREKGADQTFTRYFHVESRSQVFKIFRSFLNLQFGSAAGPANTLFRNVMIGYDDPPVQWSPENQGTCATRGDYAYMVNFKPPANPQIGFLTICPRAFERLTTSTDLPMMKSADDKDTFRCDDVMNKGYAWQQMFGLSGLLLHELLHWNVLVVNAQADLGGFISQQENVYLGDFNSAGILKGCDPPSGYGPWNAQRLRKVDGGNPEVTLRNVENYVWYAHEVYWQALCHLDAPLGPAIREQGTQPEFGKVPEPPAVPGQGAPAACLLPQNWNLPEAGDQPPLPEPGLS